VSTTSEGVGTKTMDILIRYFRSKYYDLNGKSVQPNDFANFAEYFVQKSIPQSLSKVRDQKNQTPTKIVEFILDLLKFNDNFENYYSDSFYLASLLESLGNLKPSSQDLADQIWKQIFRYLNYDKVHPSFNNLLTQACLSAASSLVVEFFPNNFTNEIMESKIQTDIEESEDDYRDSVSMRVTSGEESKKECQVREPHLFPINFIDIVNDEVLDEHLRIHAFSCLVKLTKAKNYLFDILLDLLERHSNNVTMRVCMALRWAETFVEYGIGIFYRVQSLESAEYRKRLYNLLCSNISMIDLNFRFSLLRLYQSIWGHHEKQTLSTESSCWNSKRRSKYRVEMKNKRDSKKRKTLEQKQEIAAQDQKEGDPVSQTSVAQPIQTHDENKMEII
jgi:hypothetical protein